MLVRCAQIARRLLALWMLLALAALAHAGDYGQELEQKYGLYPDFPANIRLQMIGQRMAQAANTSAISFSIFNHEDLNALALPDGRIYVTSTMATITSDDELAYVLGHEVTHITEGHAKRQSQRATGGAILGAILVAVLGGDESDIRMGADIAGGLTFGHYSRKDEHRADNGSVKLMARSGYDTREAATAMQRLIDKYGRGDASLPVLGWFATHPDSQSRKDRLLKAADELAKKPPQSLPAPLGVAMTLDRSAEHARPWIYDYAAYLTSAHGQGRLVMLSTAPVLAQSPAADTAGASTLVTAGATTAVQATAASGSANAGKDKKEPLPAVTVVMPQAPVGYRIAIALRRVPAGGAATVENSTGTAVEATVQWKQLSSGMSGACVAVAQTKRDVPWMAHEQLTNSEALHQLSDGRERNIEGTLEAIALRRAMMAFAEIVEADGPIDHGAPVTIRMTTAGLRPGDYVLVVRNNYIVAEVCVVQVGKKEITGSVLWGTHTWKRGDRFVAADEG